MGKIKKVLAICSALIPTAEIWVINSLNYIATMGKVDFKFQVSNEVTIDDINQTDVLICIRGGYQKDLDIVNECKKRNKYIIYFLDDDLLNIPRYVDNYSYYLIVINTLKEIIQLSNCLWVANENLKNNYKNLCHNVVVTNPPALLLDCKTSITQKCRNEKIVIGFSGSTDHGKMLDKILDEPIRIILNKYKDKVTFEFMGAKPLLIEKYKLIYVPCQFDFQKYKNIFTSRDWDIAVAPTENTGFNACKSYIKFLDYGSIGVPGIYSNSEPYTRVVVNGENGILTDNTIEEWVNALSYLIENENIRNHIRQKAYNQLKNEFNLKYISEILINKIPQIIS